ncbi:MAG: methyltransferase [Muribaculaceae bacterium]|nr:methyltransferase [Muribaculaceae bacterium]
MNKNISKFRFKHFAVSHHRSSMKVGVDGVLIGCWATVEGVKHILDVGTGCGLIALIMAQRAPDARIDAIDIDAPSIEEASENILESRWSDRINIVECGYAQAKALKATVEGGFDLIISNPPYFDSGVKETVTSREKARHQGELSPTIILRGAMDLLTTDGRIAMVVPTEISGQLDGTASSLGYRLERKCLVRGHKNAPYKRSLLQWRFDRTENKESEPETEHLTLELSPGVPTDDYRELCRDFYLRF